MKVNLMKDLTKEISANHNLWYQGTQPIPGLGLRLGQFRPPTWLFG